MFFEELLMYLQVKTYFNLSTKLPHMHWKWKSLLNLHLMSVRYISTVIKYIVDGDVKVVCAVKIYIDKLAIQISIIIRYGNSRNTKNHIKENIMTASKDGLLKKTQKLFNIL